MSILDSAVSTMQCQILATIKRAMAASADKQADVLSLLERVMHIHEGARWRENILADALLGIDECQPVDVGAAADHLVRPGPCPCQGSNAAHICLREAALHQEIAAAALLPRPADLR